MRLLPVIPEHAAVTAELATFHTDPSDRSLIAQARQEHLGLLTANRALLAYGASVRLAV